jgi:hypothetical protein
MVQTSSLIASYPLKTGMTNTTDGSLPTRILRLCGLIWTAGTSGVNLFIAAVIRSACYPTGTLVAMRIDEVAVDLQVP